MRGLYKSFWDYFEAVEKVKYFKEKGNAMQQKFKEIVQEIDSDE